MKIWRCWVPYPFRFFIYAAECITYSQNPPSIVLERVLCILGRFAVFWKYAGSIRSIRKPFGIFGNHSETILKTFGKQTESIRWYIAGKHIRREIRTVSKISPLSYSENIRNGIRPSVNGPWLVYYTCMCNNIATHHVYYTVTYYELWNQDLV
jgi:hypothetical protein